jgi:hypothetical protein
MTRKVSMITSAGARPAADNPSSRTVGRRSLLLIQD